MELYQVAKFKHYKLKCRWYGSQCNYNVLVILITLDYGSTRVTTQLIKAQAKRKWQSVESPRRGGGGRGRLRVPRLGWSGVWFFCSGILCLLIDPVKCVEVARWVASLPRPSPLKGLRPNKSARPRNTAMTTAAGGKKRPRSPSEDHHRAPRLQAGSERVVLSALVPGTLSFYNPRIVTILIEIITIGRQRRARPKKTGMRATADGTRW